MKTPKVMILFGLLRSIYPAAQTVLEKEIDVLGKQINDLKKRLNQQESTLQKLNATRIIKKEDTAITNQHIIPLNNQFQTLSKSESKNKTEECKEKYFAGDTFPKEPHVGMCFKYNGHLKHVHGLWRFTGDKAMPSASQGSLYNPREHGWHPVKQ